ncbi:Inosose isomerase [Rosistilla oblonga]|uniref:sugar phosphate isomerase/epimerase family protein n=1 Tax=Rosistilla oblonga TaxID=2527990 RepID=UPI00118A99A9|nr:sugar phosphate isomerase/epimerase family protein [Rosistilla oblonga]QDV14565.1 Inosose isomerase [Rosistilla oblonga]
MTDASMNRRSILSIAAATTLVGSGLPTAPAKAADTAASDEFGGIRFCLNTSTVRGQELTITEQVDLAASSGYDAIEPWVRDLVAYKEAGGSLPDLRKRIEDSGITVESAIGFAQWIVDDDAQRQKGLEQARSDMELLKSIGGKRIAAPPVGATKEAGPALPVIAKRYADLLNVGAEVGVTPELELWGFSKTLNRLGELAYVATEAGHPDACVLPDVYHIYKGGSDFAGLAMIEASRMPAFHMNDYPANPPWETIGDADRVYPGDGIAPLDDIISLLHRNGFRGYFSLELFNRDYWKQPASEVATTGLRKMKAAVRKALA